MFAFYFFGVSAQPLALDKRSLCGSRLSGSPYKPAPCENRCRAGRESRLGRTGRWPDRASSGWPAQTGCCADRACRLARTGHWQGLERPGWPARTGYYAGHASRPARTGRLRVARVRVCLRKPAAVRVTRVVLSEPGIGRVAGIRVCLGEPAVVRVAPVVLSEPGVSRVALCKPGIGRITGVRVGLSKQIVALRRSRGDSGKCERHGTERNRRHPYFRTHVQSPLLRAIPGSAGTCCRPRNGDSRHRRWV